MRIKLEKQHYQWGLTAFLVILCSVLVFFILYKFSILSGLAETILNVISPFIYGIVMAYLVCPIYNFTVGGIYRLLNRGPNKLKLDMTISKICGSVVSLAVIVIVVAGVLWMVIPGLFDSITMVVEMLPAGFKSLNEWVNHAFANLPIAQEAFDKWSDNITSYALNFATNTILPKSGDVATAVSGAMINAFGVFFNFLLGVIICIYFLNMKDILAAQAKKLILALFRESTAEEILLGADYTNKTFGGFISGKILDSLIVGVICFIVMTVFGWEYSLLISCIIFVTNIIPFFGPFIGAIPSALLLMMVNPMHGVYFIIFAIIMQQIDGNILGPLIVGDSTGLASFWVLFSVIVGGGLFGFAGMVLGTPVFAVIYAYCSRALNKRLGKKGFSTSTLDYKVDKYRTKKPREKRRRRAPILRERKSTSNVSEMKADDENNGMDER